MGPDGCPVEVKPGCGGFGIRNFLTLFLSIEVSKAMLDKSAALSRGDEVAAASAARRVGIFKEQLDESNPILTAISDAMTAEGKCLDKMKRPTTSDDEKVRQAQGCCCVGWTLDSPSSPLLLLTPPPPIRRLRRLASRERPTPSPSRRRRATRSSWSVLSSTAI